MKTTLNFRNMITMLSIVFSLSVSAQNKYQPNTSNDYRNAVGIRAGVTSGLTYKHKFNRGNAFEAIVSAWPYDIGFTALYEKHMPLGAPGLNLYMGAGGHANVGDPYTVAYYRYDGNRRYLDVYRTGGYGIGVDGIIGVEYKIKPIPLSISTDLKPFMEANDHGNIFMSLDPSIGIKFTF